MGRGMRLGIPRHSEGPAVLIPDPCFPCGQNQVLHITTAVLKELMSTQFTRPIPEFTVDGIIGWREHGLPGEEYFLYGCLM